MVHIVSIVVAFLMIVARRMFCIESRRLPILIAFFFFAKVDFHILFDSGGLKILPHNF